MDPRTELHQRISTLPAAQVQRLLALLDAEKSAPNAPKAPGSLPFRRAGTMPGLVAYMAADFHAPLTDFSDYMPE